jgi:D-alanyl-D-alanine carboxypeptidase/D-alanyl-D-alanine-endopeptidase (penicillin-binding protein 4)
MNNPVRNFFFTLCLLSTAFILLVGSSCRQTAGDLPDSSTENLPAAVEPNISHNAPLIESTNPTDIRRCDAAKLKINAGGIENAQFGMMVIDLGAGQVVCAVDEKKNLTPASLQKLITSVAALEKLGPDFRWKTSLSAAAAPDSGVVSGDLILYGTGAPDFDDAAIKRLASDLKRKGVTAIRGRVVGDESYFNGDKTGDGWTWNELQWYYGAEASALTFNENQTAIALKDGKLTAASEFVTTRGEVRAADGPDAIGVKREPGENEVYVWGKGSKLNARVSVSKPALWAAESLRRELIRSGIEVNGAAVVRDWKSNERFDPASAVELASVESEDLAAIIKRMNKDSLNLPAELILRTLGKREGATAPDENPVLNQLRGDDAAGASVIRKWLIDNKIGSESDRIHDGSGLSRLNSIAPETFARLLIYAAKMKHSTNFRSSLSAAGIDGTLSSRFPRHRGKIFGKTGSMMYVGGLAGYASRSGTPDLAFVLLINNQTRHSGTTALLDSLLETFLAD